LIESGSLTLSGIVIKHCKCSSFLHLCV
jgi:hypothetical protein